MDRDRKSQGLKLLQGQIWEQGYRSGELRGQVFHDVAQRLRRWRAERLDIAIYSSGSTLAQRRLFESLPEGDLTPLIAGFFDTAVGPKTSPASYIAICHALGRKPHEMLFVSDVTAELDAARSAGLHVLLSVRPGNLPQPDAANYEVINWE
jgi:enolase-phosphatase E1